MSRWLTRHSLLYAKSRASWYMVGARRINAKYAAEPAPAVIEQGVRRYQDELASFLTLAQARGVKVVLIEAVHVSGSGTITEPDSVIRREWEVNFPAISTETLLATYQRFSEAQRETAARFGATVIATSGFGLRGLKWFSTGDPIHFNDQGADRMGLKVAETLAGGLLGGPDCTTQTPSTGAR